MAERLNIHPITPQANFVVKAAQALDGGDIIAYPTDSGYALACSLDNKSGLERIRQIRTLDKHHQFTLMLKDLSHISDYALLNNINFRLLKKALPGSYTFILPSTKLVPARLLHKKRKTIGIRVSGHVFVQSLLAKLTDPIMSVSLNAGGDSDSVFALIADKVDYMVDMGYCPTDPTTVIDLVTGARLIRQGSARADFLL